MLLWFFINSQWSGGEVLSPQVFWSNLEQEYAHLRVAPGAISLVEKNKLSIKQASQRQQLEGSHKPHHELHIYRKRDLQKIITIKVDSRGTWSICDQQKWSNRLICYSFYLLLNLWLLSGKKPLPSCLDIVFKVLWRLLWRCQAWIRVWYLFAYSIYSTRRSNPSTEFIDVKML